VRHEQALAGFLVASLKLCAAAGVVRVGTVALDGIKLAGNAADKANRTHDQLQAEVAEILRQAAEVDQGEDRLFGDARGDGLPKALASKADRLARPRQAKAQLAAEAPPSLDGCGVPPGEGQLGSELGIRARVPPPAPHGHWMTGPAPGRGRSATACASCGWSGR
jgi:hypothetical protein